MNHKQTLDRIVAKYISTNNSAYLLDDLLQLTAEVTRDVNEKNSQLVPIGKALKNYLNRTINDNQNTAIYTGFEKFDERLGGFLPGEFVIIGGRPGMGKSSIIIHLALEMAKEDNHVLYVSLDASTDLLSVRFLSKLSNVSQNKIIGGELSDTEESQLIKCAEELENSSIYVDDKPSHVFSIKEKCRQLKEAGQLDVLIIDYLQLVGGSSRKNTNRELEVSMICKELKSIAREFNVCVIAASQLSRAVESRGGDKRPQLSDLRESGAIEQDADKIIFVYRPSYYNINEDENGNSLENIMELMVAKNRSGSLTSTVLKTNTSLTSFEEILALPSFVDKFSNSRMMENWDTNDDENVPF